MNACRTICVMVSDCGLFCNQLSLGKVGSQHLLPDILCPVEDQHEPRHSLFFFIPIGVYDKNNPYTLNLSCDLYSFMLWVITK